MGSALHGVPSSHHSWKKNRQITTRWIYSTKNGTI